MNVVPYKPAMAGELTSLYNELIRDVPHCYPVGVDEFAAALAPAAGEGRSQGRLHSEAAFVAAEGKSVLGFVHVAAERPEKEADPEQGLIRFLGYRRGRRAAGQLLLEAAEEHCRQHNVTEVKTFELRCRYRFYYLEPARLSDRLDHVRALLQFNDYEPLQGEVFLDWPDYEPPEPAPADVPAEIKVEWEDGRGQRPNLRVKAIRDGKEVGLCYCVSDGESSGAPEAQDWVFVLELGVHEPLQGRGLGRHLLQRALKEAHGKGYRHAAISTWWRNYRAFLFYSNYGFRAADWTYSFRRELK